MHRLGERDAVDPASYEGSTLSPEAEADARLAAREALAARARNAPVILAFGAHSIKNGLAGLLIRLMRGGYVTHFATNGAGVIHDCVIFSDALYPQFVDALRLALIGRRFDRDDIAGAVDALAASGAATVPPELAKDVSRWIREIL